MTVCVKGKLTKREGGHRRPAEIPAPGGGKPALVGYARVSTEEQNLALQQDALRRAPCDRVFEDHGVSGTQWTRPGLAAALKALTPGDTLVVWRLDRLGRSMLRIVSLIEDLAAQGIGFRSLTESFDTGTSIGKLNLHMMAALAEFERTLISERTRAGLVVARANGSRLGRPPRYGVQVREAALRSVKDGAAVKDVARAHGMHPRTLYRMIEAAGR